jgi:hypothetical protein
MDIVSCFGMWNSCPKSVRTFQLQLALRLAMEIHECHSGDRSYRIGRNHSLIQKCHRGSKQRIIGRVSGTLTAAIHGLTAFSGCRHSSPGTEEPLCFKMLPLQTARECLAHPPSSLDTVHSDCYFC